MTRLSYWVTGIVIAASGFGAFAGMTRLANPKFEYLNPKQIQNANVQNLKLHSNAFR